MLQWVVLVGHVRVIAVRVVEAAERTLDEALGLGAALCARARADGAPHAAASVVRGPAVLLGAVQRAGRVVDLAACRAGGVRVVRRDTTGTAAALGDRGVVWTIALPHVAAMYPDATPGTLLNRNVRGLLRGFARAGATAAWFGREWIALSRRPAAIVGFDVLPDGVVLLEVVAGLDRPPAVPDPVAAPEERALDRWRGRAAVALVDALPAGRAPIDVARAVLDGLAGLHRERPEPEPAPDPGSARPEVEDSDDPVPSGLIAAPPRPVAIGLLDAASGAPGARAWVGGDVLAPRHVLEAVAGAAARGDPPPTSLAAAPVEGALPEDLVRAVRAAIDEASRRQNVPP